MLQHFSTWEITRNFAEKQEVMINYNKNFALPNECWKDVVGYEGLYQVSTFGRVKSLERISPQGKLLKERIMKPDKTKYGYLRIHLCKDGTKKWYSVHRLVAQAWLKPVSGKNIVNHLDEVKDSNHYSNIEWCDVTYNNNYGTRNARATESMTNGKQSKPVQGISPETGKVVVEFPSTMEAGRSGYDQATVSACCRGEKGHKTHHGLIWQYK